MHRTRREVHYPSELDVKDPFILLVHQGMVEDIFIEDMRERGIEVTRSSPFQRYVATDDPDAPIEAICHDNKTGSSRSFKTKYLIGCDGAHSNVRKSIPGAQMIGESSNSKWGVLDGMSYLLTMLSHECRTNPCQASLRLTSPIYGAKSSFIQKPKEPSFAFPENET
jgi:2-polyprenyl-6-methoxyphenol hydroxylase-like FAD-dependent oxidoreductase